MIKISKIDWNHGLQVWFLAVGGRTVGYTGFKGGKFQGVRFSLSPALMDRPWLNDYNEWRF